MSERRGLNFFVFCFFVKENIPTDNDNVFRCVKHKQNIIMGSVEEGRSVREVWYKHLKTKVKLIIMGSEEEGWNVREVWFKHLKTKVKLIWVSQKREGV